ncbi:MAG: NTP transferase domain-containing protein [Propionibacteriaceae bacterium]|nr:NTP transferase domain-containing protein [Propionibacteriaceae bacterium]
MSSTQPVVVLLAAGVGQRMNSSRAKVLHTVGGHTLLRHALDAVEAIGPAELIVVVGYQRDQVRAHLAEIAPGAVIAVQDDPRGTGDAVRVGLAAVEDPTDDTMVVVVCADLPMLDGATLRAMISTHRNDRDAVTVLGMPDDGDDGAYVFDYVHLQDALNATSNRSSLGDVVSSVRLAGGQIGIHAAQDEWVVRGVDDRVQLAAVSAEYNRRVVERWMSAGVTVVDPATTWIEADVDLNSDVTLLPGTMLAGATSVAWGASIGPETTVKDSEVGEQAVITRSTVDLSVVGAGSRVGPYARLRPGSQIGRGGIVGPFVETKNVTLGVGSRLGHLVYCGDATLGDGVDVGAGVIFANWDSTNKAQIHIGEGAVIGAGALIIPPAEVAAGAVISPGATVQPVAVRQLDEPDTEPGSFVVDEDAARRGMEEQ